ncbi:hypothetical protein A6E00_15675 [Vibrio diabolicus]|uniref:hypothetical protein n=1 Tax=Vibrio diabolicus TaxID=50719 RepID=UPI00080F38C2|nr:hypothetical protein [Vibrio diabolicus]OCH63855.1 hypothetical protein A6E00_15675 [Vibrio diabolicus]
MNKTPFIVTSGKNLLESSSYLLNHIDDGELTRNPNKLSFILTVAAAFEATINDAIVVWAHQRFPNSDYKRHASAFLSMNLMKKLDALGFLLSSGCFITDNESDVYQSLSKLVKLRNEVAHSKDFFTDANIEFHEHENGDVTFELPKEVASKFSKSPLTTTKNRAIEIFEAVEHLFKVCNYDIEMSDSSLFKPL